MELSRRDLLKLSGGAAAAGALNAVPSAIAEAQTPKRGGVFRIRGEDPIGFDPQLIFTFKTMINLSFTHSRLLKVKAGSSVVPGTTPLEGDLAESWSRTSDTSWVFTLRKGVRWHNKPPMNGRELTAEDVKWSFERFLTLKGNPHRGLLESVEKVEAPDKYTVRFTTTEPFAWLPQILASTVMWVLPREAVEKFGDAKKPEACIGTGPWMLERYEQGVRVTFVRNPNYFVPGLPYADGVEATVDEDTASRLGNWMAGKFDFAPEYDMVVRRLDLETAKQRKPGLQTVPFVWLVGGITWLKLDQEPFKDIRVRRALALASSWKEILESNAFSNGLHGAPNPAVPAAFTDWSIPISELPAEARVLYDQNIPEAKRLLAQAGYANGLKFPFETTGTVYGPDYMDAVQVTLKNWKSAGAEADLKLKEYGAYISSTIFGKFDKAAGGLFGAWDNPESYLYRYYMPGQITNASGVNDPKATEMIKLQRRTFDEKKRREIIFDIQRYLAGQVYHLYAPSISVVSAWEPYVKNFGPNFGHDYGGRLTVAWIDK